MKKLLFAIFIVKSVLLQANQVNPADISNLYLKSNKFESDDLTWYRFSVRPDWGQKVRVNLGPGGSVILPDGNSVTTENRYYYFNTNSSSFLPALNIQQLFAADSDVRISGVSKVNSNLSYFAVSVSGGNFLYSLEVTCTGEAEISGPHRARNSQFHRFQIRLDKCILNDKARVLEKAWMTVDVFSFDQTSGKAGVLLRSLYVTRPAMLDGRKISYKDLQNLALSLSDRLLMDLFAKVGFKVTKSYLWQHQN